jgi:hypothetical protein
MPILFTFAVESLFFLILSTPTIHPTERTNKHGVLKSVYSGN